MKKLFFIFLLISFSLNAQTAKNYYVHVKLINIHQEPNKDSKIIASLKKYNNVQVIDENFSNWLKVSYKNNIGYVTVQSLKEGKAIVSNYTVRTGARCKDGSSSSATGRGACSHHGGVSYWITKSKKSVRIEN